MKFSTKNIGSKLSSPWLVAFIPFILTLSFVSGLFSRYNLKLISSDTIGNNLSMYCDLDGNGNSEFIYFYNYQNAQILIHDFNQKLEEVYDLPGEWFDGHDQIPAWYIGDFDGDSVKEIFAFSINNHDSLFVTVLHHKHQEKLILNKYVTTLPKTGDKYDYILTPLGLEDNNGDGFPELLFVINAGFPLQPRAIFAWDLKNDNIYRSPLMGNALKSRVENIYFQDVNGDSVKEIFLRSVAPKNYKDSASIPFTDQKSWLMVFTKDLKFLFQPVQIGKTQVEISAIPVEYGDSTFIGAGIYNYRVGENMPFFQLYNLDGKKRSEFTISDFELSNLNQLIKRNNRYYMVWILEGSFRISLLNNNFTKIEKTVSVPTVDYYYFFYDVDSDGEDEILVYAFLDEKLHIYRGNLKNETVTHVEQKFESQVQGISVGLKNHKPDHFQIIFNGVAKNLSYSKNPMYYLNFVFALIYYFILVYFFILLKKSWVHNLEKKQQTELEMQNLQIQTVLNQLNPHFTFNAINTVGSAILGNEPQKAYESLTRVSRLFRKIVDHGFLPYKTLEEEIDFVHDYLEVEKLRFGDNLKYDIRIEKGIDLKIQIPKMLIQLFAENAIKHGLFYKKGVGKINIEVARSEKAILILLEDNGIGRKKAKEMGEGRTGKGMIILENYLKLFREKYNREITFQLSDVMKNEKIGGTRVEISIFL